MALDTAKEYLENKKIVLLKFPMGRVNKEDYRLAAEKIDEMIPEKGSGCFLTIGDPMIYSTFIYLMEELRNKNIDTEVVSGIPSLLAAAAESKVPLTKKGESFLLCDQIKPELIKKVDSLAILKTSKNKEEIIDHLDAIDYSFTYIKRVSLEESTILRQKKDILQDQDYISLILGRKKEG